MLHISDVSDFSSPFSQKNIQECRCGTESCRGVLGPKPKKPVEEKSVASSIITGTKRKLQDLLGGKRAGSESSHGSPKKRKMFGETSAMVKARNALLRSESARERAEREANELSRQNASRENRALKRSTSANTVKHARSTNLRAAQPTIIRHTRHTKVSFQHRLSKPGALKVVKKTSGTTSATRRTNAKLSNKKGFRSLQRPSTPMRETNTEISDSEEGTSPNITPASLRSASRKSTQLSPNVRQHQETDSSSEGKDRVSHQHSTGVSKLQQRASTSTQLSSKNTSQSTMTYHPTKSRSRNVRGRCAT